MYRAALLIVLCLIATLSYSQEIPETIFATDVGEPNMLFQTTVLDSNLYFSGQYFDAEIGRWTLYFGRIRNGIPELVMTEKMDTVIGVNVSNTTVVTDDGFYVLGKNFTYERLYYCEPDITNITPFISIHRKDKDFAAFGFDYNPVSEAFVFTGTTVFNEERSSKIVSITDSDYLEYTEISEYAQYLNSEPLIKPNGDIYVLFSDFVGEDLDNPETYLICLNKDLELIFSTKETNSIQNLQLYNGILLDHEMNIIFSGFELMENNGQKAFIPVVTKIDSLGKELWTYRSSIENNAKNFVGWAHWETIIEAKNDDGYIVVGSTLFNGDTNNEYTKATVLKLSTDGDSLWSMNYCFGECSGNVYNEFADVSLTKDKNYFVGGTKNNFNSPTEEPWLQSIMLVLKDKTPTSTSDTPKNNDLEISLYPNPTTQNFTIANKSNVESLVTIFNSSGVEMSSFRLRGGGKEITSLNNAPDGMYFVRSCINDGVKDCIYQTLIIN